MYDQLPSIHVNCDGDPLRAYGQHVYFHKHENTAYFVATNAHILTYFPANKYLSDEFIQALPNCMYLHAKDYKQLTDKAVISIEYLPESKAIKIYAKNKESLIPLCDCDKIGQYPNYFNVIPTKSNESEKVTEIGYNADFLERLNKIYPKKLLKFSFNGSTRATVIEPMNEDYSHIKSILMPVMNLNS